MDFSWIDFGSLPDWVEAIGTSGAVLYAGIQFHRDRTKDREQRQAAEAARRDSEAAQARLVTVSVKWEFNEVDGFGTVIDVANISDRPVFNLAPVILERGSGRSVLDEQRTVDRRYDQLPRSVSVRMRARPYPELAAPRNGLDAEGYEAPSRAYEVGIALTDANGLRWLRTPGGKPERLIGQD